MIKHKNFKSSPWDCAVFGQPCYEIEVPEVEMLEIAAQSKGHYTVKIDCLAPKVALQKYGFYYCDTLIEPYCTPERFIPFYDEKVHVTRDITLDALLEICHGSFSYGRFHRDFNLTREQSDKRYDNWLAQLHIESKVYGLIYKDQLAGFIALEKNSLVLHAIDNKFRGQGLAKYLWTPICESLYKSDFTEIVSSISAGNLAILNLYSRLGFSFRHSVDVYHKFTA